MMMATAINLQLQKMFCTCVASFTDLQKKISLKFMNKKNMLQLFRHYLEQGFEQGACFRLIFSFHRILPTFMPVVGQLKVG